MCAQFILEGWGSSNIGKESKIGRVGKGRTRGEILV